MLAEMMQPLGPPAWLAIGIVVGYLAGFVLDEGRYGQPGDLAVGLAGAAGSGILANSFAPAPESLGWSAAAAAVGAFVLIASLRFLTGGRPDAD